MPTSPDIFRALGALCEPPEPGHATIAAALGLPPLADAADHTDVFVFQLMPYAAPYLSPDGMLGGEASDRVAGFWRALQLPAPAEPDHLAGLLGFYAALAERENDEQRPGWAGGWREARRALLWEHLLTWVPIYATTMATLRSGFHAAWARLLHQALLEEAQALAPPPAAPLHLRDVPELPGPGSGGFERALLAPVRSGLLITRSDLAHAATLTGLGARPGGRAFTLRALLEQDRAATFEWLAQRATWWAQQHRNAVPALGRIAQHWLDRAQASLRAIEQVKAPGLGLPAADPGQLRGSDRHGRLRLLYLLRPRQLSAGQVLKVMATDRGSLADIPAWAEENGEELLDSGEEDGAFVFYVRKAPAG